MHDLLADTRGAIGWTPAERLFRLGMMCPTGQSMPLDMVATHKWCNIAATLGLKEAFRLRNEVAAEMSEG